MALEQISGEIKKVLQAVKTEFKMFGDVLNTAQKKILDAHDDFDRLVGTDTRQIQRKPRVFEEFSTTESSLLLVANSEEDISIEKEIN